MIRKPAHTPWHKSHLLLSASLVLLLLAGQAAAEDYGFSVRVDGKQLAGPAAGAAAATAADIQVKFDGFDVKPYLNVATVPLRQGYVSGETVNFRAALNYNDWITAAEMRIFKAGANVATTPLATVAVTGRGTASWVMPADAPAQLVYVLRVVGHDGRFDETKPQSLLHVAALPEGKSEATPDLTEDKTALRNIDVYGGSVTVTGSNLAAGAHVAVMGQSVTVSPDGTFVSQRILPPGKSFVSVKVAAPGQHGINFEREINIPSSEWFYVALADLTVGTQSADPGIEAVRPGEFDGLYTKGHLAFYLKGKIKGKTLITASMDSGENDLKSLLTGLDGKDPRQFLKRIDPEKYYPVYGDDSSQTEDAPTEGKFYVRIERGDSRVLWGNFKTEPNGTVLQRSERALYGADALYRSPEALPNGARRAQAEAYAALPGTLPQRDIFQGTGGSAYFLKHQDITVGSETLSLQLRDPVTGTILSNTPLRSGTDYSIDYAQGLVLLTQALASTAGSGFPAVAANQFLAVSYEYTPATGDADSYAVGGHANYWLVDGVRIGGGGSHEKISGADHTIYGADVRLEATPGTYLEAEAAHTEGPSIAATQSADGGLTLSDTSSDAAIGKPAYSWRVSGTASLADLSKGAVNGTANAHYQHRDEGFSGLDQQTPVATDDWGASMRVQTSSTSAAEFDYVQTQSADGRADASLAAKGDINLAPGIVLTPALQYTRHQDPSPLAADIGQRLDIGARLTHLVGAASKVYAYVSGTALRDETRLANNRAGLGGETQLSETLLASGEVSYGTGGPGGLAKLSYNPTPGDSYYVGYQLDPLRDMGGSTVLIGDDLGKIVAGAKHHVSDTWSTFAEDSYDLFGATRTLAQTYGVSYNPDAHWSFGANLELGHITDNTINPTTLVKNSDFDRKSFATSAGFKDEAGDAAHAKAEIRFDQSDDGTRDLTQYLASGTLLFKANPDWRLLANLDAVITSASDATRGGTYVEGSLGFAYRPVGDDKLNVLARYTFLYDDPAANQVDVSGTTLGPQQLSHIFSADANYDLTQIVSVGAKYAFRIGDTRPRDGSADWTPGSAHLGVLRVDFNIVNNWDALAEARALWQPESNSADYGALLAVYRHFGPNFKLGVGYNFGRFSDDLRNQAFNSQGVFINAVGQF